MAQLIINIALSSSIYIIISLSFSIIYKTTKFFNIAHAAIITCGGYFVFFCSVQLDIPILAGIILGILATITIGLLSEVFIFRLLRIKGLSSWELLVASLGLYVVLQNLISLIWGDAAKSIQLESIETGNILFGAYITDIQIGIVFSILVLTIVFFLFLNYTWKGKALRAVSSDLHLSTIYGINSNYVINWAVIVGSGLAAIGGILVFFDTSLTPTMGFSLFLYGVIAMIIGGMGKTIYLVLGSLILATAQHMSAYHLDSKWMNATAFIILIIFLAWKPYGITGQRLKKAEV